MKHYRLNIIMAVLAVVSLTLGMSCSSNNDEKTDDTVVVPPVEEKVPEVTDVSNTDCQYDSRSTTRADQASPTIVLKKEGEIIYCELQRYGANCGVSHFDINSEYKRGKDNPDTLFLDILPVVPAMMDCSCPHTVNFTLRNVKADSIFLNCGWYTGMVSFRKTNQVTIEMQGELVTIDGWRYYLYKPGQQAVLWGIGKGNRELKVPSTVSYEGQTYFVMELFDNAFYGGDEITKIILPKSIYKLRNPLYTNLYGRLKNLENIEVEAGNRMLSSVDGVLYSNDRKALYCHPRANKRTSYTVLDGVEKIGNSAFAYSQNLTSIRLPESVTIIESGAFFECANLKSIYIPGKLERRDENWDIFGSMKIMNASPTIYVPESEVEYIKTLYDGPVLPL